MSVFAQQPRRRALLGAALGAALLAGGPLTAAHPAHAAYGCRADPLVHLTNGTIIDVSAFIAADASAIQGITYVLHGPKDTTFSTVTWPTWDQFTAIETFQYIADQDPGLYRTDTLVRTGIAAPASVTAYLDVSDQGLYSVALEWPGCFRAWGRQPV